MKNIKQNCKLWCDPHPPLPPISERERAKKKEKQRMIDWLIPDAIPEQSGLDEWDQRNPGDVDIGRGAFKQKPIKTGKNKTNPNTKYITATV